VIRTGVFDTETGLPSVFLEVEVKPRFVLEFDAARYAIALSPNDDVRCGKSLHFEVLGQF
jgi:hypothetical protein